MRWISKTMITLVICVLILLAMNVADGQDTDEHDPKCEVDCTCCKDRVCGPMGLWPEGNCYSGCIDGYRGGRCYRKCTNPNCAECPVLAYICTRCKAGYYETSSNCSKCPINCKTCSSSTDCTDCTAEFYSANGFNDCRYRYCPSNCGCEENTCVSCESGYYDVSSSCISKCPSNCDTCSAKHTCNSCSAGYYNGYEFDITDGILLNNCTHGCRNNCISCSSYNSCLQCEPGKYGLTCQTDCSFGCKSQICEIQTGNCKCKNNFSGNNCNDCFPSTFGTTCEKNCPRFCKNNRCDRYLGICLYGCTVNAIVGETCSVCADGYYGDVCNATCSKNCKNGKCERESGECSYGCKDNFNGKWCETCGDGKYGESCSPPCPQNCAGDICNRTSGHCFACSGNYYGDDCNNCTTGYYGQTCQVECSPQCLYGVCSRDAGKCDIGCKEIFSGDKCCIEGGHCLICSSKSVCSKCKSGYYGGLCNEICPSNCLDSCDFVTGTCNFCINNLYGLFCNKTCSLSCKVSQDENSSRCESEHGKCIHGCENGFYGSNCSQLCNSQCIDNLCVQDTGKCSKGYNKQTSDHKCPLSSEKQVSVDSKQTTIIVMGFGIALLIVVVISLIACLFVAWKRQTFQRSTKDARGSSEIELSTSDIAHRRNEDNPSPEQHAVYYNVTLSPRDYSSTEIPQTSEYEKIKSVQDQEHEYEHISSAV